MGNMRIVRVFGLELGIERWGRLRPDAMWTLAGKCFKPVCLGIWRRAPSEDRVG